MKLSLMRLTRCISGFSERLGEANLPNLSESYLKGAFALYNKKKKGSPILFFAAVLFFMGVASILYPIVGSLFSVLTAHTEISDYNSQVEEMGQEASQDALNTARHFNDGLFDGTLYKSDAKCLTVGDGIISYLDIPSINVYLPVYYGTSDEVLKKGCGYVEYTSLPVGSSNSHCVIAGHTGLPTADMLTDIDQLVVGDVFYVHTLKEVFAYKVDKILVVLPDDTESLSITPGEDRVTLLTCTPYGINSHRLLVSGLRTPYTPDTESDDTPVLKPSDDNTLSADVLRRIALISSIVFAALLVFTVVCIILVRDSLRRKKCAADHSSEGVSSH